MLSIITAIVSCVASNLLIRYVAEHYTYNVAFILLMIECLKLLICACVTRYINKEQPFKVRWGFIVNAILYSIVNVLTYQITSIYSVFIQHKLFWVVIFSLLLLKKSFSIQQYISLVVVCMGCMLVKMSNIEGDISVMAISLIVLQGICSSLASVWVEKMMKVEDRPKVSEDESKQKLYWFLSDSFRISALQKRNDIDKIIVVTHTVPPKDEFCSEGYSTWTNTQLKVTENSKVTHWCFGHVHQEFDVKIDNIRFICHPRGRPDDNNSSDYDIKHIKLLDF